MHVCVFFLGMLRYRTDSSLRKKNCVQEMDTFEDPSLTVVSRVVSSGTRLWCGVVEVMEGQVPTSSLKIRG